MYLKHRYKPGYEMLDGRSLTAWHPSRAGGPGAESLRGQKLRVDMTLIQTPIEHPTDIGLLVDSVRVITHTVK